MNLRKQVEPLKKAALQASSLQRHAHHAASRLTWMKRWLKRAYRHHAQSRELKRWVDLSLCRPAESRRRPMSTLFGPISRFSRHQHAIEQALELLGSRRELTVPRAGGVGAAEQP